jgi:hypothetical protein
MPVQNAGLQIRQAVLGWPGTSAQPHRFGGVEFKRGRREIGHIHGDSLVDIPFPRKVRDEIVAAGRAQPHHLLSESGWVSLYLRQSEDVAHAIDLLRASYEITITQKSQSKAGSR